MVNRSQEGILIGALLGSAVGCAIFGWPIAGLILFAAGIVCWKFQNERRKKMQPSNHSHWCPRCKAHKYCPQITHCRKPDESVCVDCQTEGLTFERAEERYYETGKWPGEKQ